MFNSKIFLAEFIGTFALIFIGAGAALTSSDILVVALAHGLTIAVFVYAYGHVSGAHFNPAVTFALFWNNTVKLGEAVFYWIAQFLGSIAAAYALVLIVTPLGGNINTGATTGALTAEYPIAAMLVEALLTFFLVNTILHTAIAGNGGKLAGLAIGFTLVAAILVGGPFTGASLNPARTLGPAIFAEPSLANPYYIYVIYLFGPLIGATLAVIVYNFLMGIDPDAKKEVIVAEVVKTSVKTKKPAVRKTAKK